jgi:predicted nuclease of predicted toxin-antitoxin system
MKFLLDESLPRKLKNDFGIEHDTVREKGRLGKKNSDLLKVMIVNGFEIFVMVDRNLRYQQNLKQLPVTIFVLCAINNRREMLAKLIPKVFKRLSEGKPGNIIEIS